MERLAVAILGQGRSGRDIHGRHLRADPRFRVVAVVDPLPERRNLAAQEYGCDVYADATELLLRRDIDLVVNATPSHLHVPVTRQLIDAGFNVICEKPLARTVAEVDELIRVADAKGVLFTVFQQSRFAPYFQKVKEVIGSGVLGRIVQVSISFSGFARRWDWQCLQEYNGGNLLNTGPHPLDQALNLMDAYDSAPEVFCAMDRANTSGNAEDYVKLVLRSPQKPLIDLEVSSCNAYPSATYVVQGTNGGLKASMTHAEWRYFIPSEAPVKELVRTPLIDAKGLPAYCGEPLEWHEVSWDVPSDQEDLFARMASEYYTMIHNWFADGTPLEVNLRQVRQQIAVIEECHRQNSLSLREFTADKLRVKVYRTRGAMGHAAADEVATKMRELLVEKGELNVIFAAAPSQNEFLAALALHRDIDWSRVNAFHMDEYVGLDQDAPQRFGNFLKERLFGIVPFRAVHYIDGNAPDVEAECKRYEALLAAYPPDIVCMGIGENGHIAFNDPHVARFNDKRGVKVVGLDEMCRNQQVNDGCFKSIEQVPTHALTLTIPMLISALSVFCMVPAASKATAVRQTVTGEVTEACPASILRTHTNAVLYLDPDSAAELV